MDGYLSDARDCCSFRGLEREGVSIGAELIVIGAKGKNYGIFSLKIDLVLFELSTMIFTFIYKVSIYNQQWCFSLLDLA